MSDIEQLTMDGLEIVARYTRSNEDRIQAALDGGAFLNRVKATLSHGEFLPYLERIGLVQRTAYDWMQLDEAGMKVATVATLGGIRAALESLRVDRSRHLEQGTGNNERYTPAYILEAVRHVTGGKIELDPASSAQANETVQASRFFTLEDDGLAQDWEAESLWLNPPFGRGEIEAFVEKLVVELDNIGLALGITHNATETGWCQDLLAESAAICFLNRRVDFPTPGEGSNSGTLRGQMMFLLGRDGQAGIQRFAEAFRQLGVIYVPHAGRD